MKSVPNKLILIEIKYNSNGYFVRFGRINQFVWMGNTKIPIGKWHNISEKKANLLKFYLLLNKWEIHTVIFRDGIKVSFLREIN